MFMFSTEKLLENCFAVLYSKHPQDKIDTTEKEIRRVARKIKLKLQ